VLALGLGVARGLQALHASGRAHRDVCPRNIMLRGQAPPSPLPVTALAPSAAVLTDLGSCAPAHVRIATRTDALRLVEEAATKSSMPYRAPELFSCDPGDEVNADATDCFSLGATLFACAFGLSPFESSRGDDGRLRVAEPSHLRTLGAVTFPSQHAFSPAFCTLLRNMLEKDAQKRLRLAAAAAELERLLLSHARDSDDYAVVILR
jgi:serine/threonine protein kinase